MRRYDLTPLLRSSVGFDRFDRLFDSANRQEGTGNSYPPYNIEKSDDDYRITMAVAGFTDADIELTVKDNTLVVQGNPLAEREGVNYLHHGIAGRGFERRFELAENVKVVGARLENGMLHVDLVRETPEHMKPRRIEINSAAA
ncbi:MAG: Hsp20 family protein [Alphaproteobacteria bacterium]|jgi:molecular chaperone IbpA|nr:Hsp20 family protein [Alphaproteobacteria bacterium]MDP6813774.1 Hsp20 family protein [Alphaproteobacteria bacterium]